MKNTNLPSPSNQSASSEYFESSQSDSDNDYLKENDGKSFFGPNSDDQSEDSEDSDISIGSDDSDYEQKEKILDLVCDKNYGNSSNQEKAEIIRNCSDKEIFKLSNIVDETDEFFTAIIEPLISHKKFKKIAFYSCSIGSESARSIAKLITENKEITIFSIENCDPLSESIKKIGDSGIEIIAEALWKNTTLKVLGIDGIGLTDNNARILIEHLKGNRTILSLGSNDYDSYSVYKNSDKINEELAQEIRGLLKRNSKYSPEKRKFLGEIKDKLVDELKEKFPPTDSQDTSIAYRVVEVVNFVMDRISDDGNKENLQKIINSFLVAKNDPRLTLKSEELTEITIAQEISSKIFQGLVSALLKDILTGSNKLKSGDSASSTSKSEILKLNSQEIEIINKTIFDYFNNKKMETLKGLHPISASTLEPAQTLSLLDQ